MESFEIPVIYKGKENNFKADLLAYKYSYKIRVEVNGRLILFEPDEERNYRAVMDESQINETETDVELLKSIAIAIENILK